jgi:hypothetical protein
VATGGSIVDDSAAPSVTVLADPRRQPGLHLHLTRAGLGSGHVRTGAAGDRGSMG